MSFRRLPAPPIKQAQVSHPVHTHLSGSRLLLARAAWISLAGLAFILFIISLPSYFAFLHILSPDHVSNAGAQISLKDLQTLQTVHLSLDFYAWYNVILNGLFVLIYALVGLVLFWRKSHDRMALLASFTLVIFPLDNNIPVLQTLPSAWGLAVQLINFLGSVSITLFFYLFPSGRFDRRWIGWLTAGMVLFWIADVFGPQASSALYQIVSFLLFVLFLGAGLVVQIYRYRRLSTANERQQTKWVFFGTVVGLTGYLVSTVVVFGLLNQVWQVGMVPFMIGYTISDLLLLLLPLCIAIAILRSRLWDIDILINRTLVYGTLTLSLTLVYAGLILGFQVLLRGVIQQTNDIALVVSTLAIYVLFQPLRQRIQAVIDRRFYRRKYDAQKTLVAFSATLRKEVDLATLSEHVLAVVQETMYPTFVSLWLLQPKERALVPSRQSTSPNQTDHS